MAQLNTSKNIHRHFGHVSQIDREKRHGHLGMVVWFTGLSGSGKSSIAYRIETLLFDKGYHVIVLDGDNIRHGLCSDLGFTNEDRVENIRRLGEVSNLFLTQGIITITAFISPFRADRQLVRNMFGPNNFVEVFCNCPLEKCMKRDCKGLYKLAISGKIPNFTGISSPYEAPDNPEMILYTDKWNIETCASQVVSVVREKTNILAHN